MKLNKPVIFLFGIVVGVYASYFFTPFELTVSSSRQRIRRGTKSSHIARIENRNRSYYEYMKKPVKERDKLHNKVDVLHHGGQTKALHLVTSAPVKKKKVGQVQWRKTLENCMAFDTKQHLVHRLFELEQSIVNLGYIHRFYEIQKKLLQGRPIKVLVIGGSITIGHGLKGWELRAWPARLEDWLNKQFPTNGTNSKHLVVNSGYPAKGTSYFKDIIENILPSSQYDLVICEFSTNDDVTFSVDQGFQPTSLLLDLEVLVLKILKRSKALLFIETYRKDRYISGEDVHAPVLKYYGIPQLSMRNILYQRKFSHMLFSSGHIHYASSGHEQLVRILSFFFCNLMQSKMYSDASHFNSSLPPLSIKKERYETLLASPETSLRADSKDASMFAPTNNTGWIWMADDAMKEKFGWLALKESGGETITFRVKVRIGIVIVGYLISYEKMGQASVTITQGNKVWNKPNKNYCLGCQIDTSNVLNGLYKKVWRNKAKGSIFISRTFPLKGHTVGPVEVTLRHLPGNAYGTKFKLLSIIGK